MSIEQEILVTGIKVVDLLAPYVKGGKIGRYMYMYSVHVLSIECGIYICMRACVLCVYWYQFYLVHFLRIIIHVSALCVCVRVRRTIWWGWCG